MVTRVPTRAMGYRHVGQVLVFDSAAKLQTDLHFWNRLLNRVVGRIEDLEKSGIAGVKDHTMARYLKNLERKVHQIHPFVRPLSPLLCHWLSSLPVVLVFNIPSRAHG